MEGPLDYVDIGDSVESLFIGNGGAHGTLMACSPVEVRIGRTSEGYVLCAKAAYESIGRRVLLVNGKVSGIRQGQGLIDQCVWDAPDN